MFRKIIRLLALKQLFDVVRSRRGGRRRRY
jgi:hypothetical protein